MTRTSDLAAEVARRKWYHTLDLADGVTTPGLFDHRPFVGRYGLPDSLEGKRVLDIGTLDGFWAFEMERRGATVTALDVGGPEHLDWPPIMRERGDGANSEMLAHNNFEFARETLGSQVTRELVSIYDATPERLGGPFDLVFCGSLLVHLRDPNLALERMTALCRGRLVLAEGYSRKVEWLPFNAVHFVGEASWLTWWIPGTRALASMVRCAGFREVKRGRRFRLPVRGGRRRIPHVVIHAVGPGSH